MTNNTKRKLNELEFLVGNTPMVEIHYKYKGKEKKAYAKLEHYNLSGSIKDRLALSCLKRAYQDGTLKAGYKIAETTSGNAGISFCAMGAYLGHECIIFMPDWMTEERKAIMKSFGAKLTLVSKEDGGFLECLKRTKEYGENEGVYLPDQFANEYNTEAHYISTGPEILKQVDGFGEKLDGFVAGVGTGGTVMGVGRYLKSVDKSSKMFPVEPANSPTLSTGYQVGKHRIGGISDEFIPAIMNLSECDGIIKVDDGDSIIMAQRLSKELGLGVGISSGANFLASLIASEQLGGNANIATVFADDNKKYFSTDYAKEEPVKDNFLTNNIELLGYKPIK